MSRVRSAAKTASRPVVIDTPLLLRALLCTDEQAQALRRGWQDGRWLPRVSPDSATRLMTALAFPRFGLSLAQRQELLADFLPYAQALRPATPKSGRGSAPTPAHADLLALALEGETAELVSHDALLTQWLARSRSADIKRVGLRRLEEFLAL